ncbi:hypothetical protein EAE96_003693 [Botrytis aclada]|nr:hypothetical protein EAE96_003693 [Botrytis aclada]
MNCLGSCWQRTVGNCGFVRRATFGAHTPITLYTGRTQAVQEGKIRIFPVATCSRQLEICPYPRFPTPSYALPKRVCNGSAALHPGLLTSEEEESSQSSRALTRASTSLPLINLSSRPVSLSQSSPNALRTIQKPHHRMDDIPRELERLPRNRLLRKR